MAGNRRARAFTCARLFPVSFLRGYFAEQLILMYLKFKPINP
jgi:hypothetical protein